MPMNKIVINQHNPKFSVQRPVKQLVLSEELADRQKYIAALQKKINVLSAEEVNREKDVSRKAHSWLTEKDRQKWKEEWEKKTEAATEFAKRMAENQRSVKQREVENRRRLLDKIDKDRQEKSKYEEPIGDRLERIRQEALQQRWEDFQEKRKHTKQLTELARCAPAKKAYLYQKMYKNFVEEIEMPELEKRKQKLAEKRSIYVPIRRDELREHADRYEEIIHKYEEVRVKEMEKRRLDSEDYMCKAQMEYKSSFTTKAIVKDMIERNKQKHHAAKQKENYTKKMTYAKIIKESYLPDASETKALELKRQIEKLKHPVRRPTERGSGTRKKSNEKANCTSNESDDVEYSAKSGIVDEIARKYRVLDESVDLPAKNRPDGVVAPAKEASSPLLPATGSAMKKSVKFAKVNQSQDNLVHKSGHKHVKEEPGDIYVDAIKAKLALLET